MANVFVSYTKSDSQWANWIATDLRGLGHTPYVHQWEIGSGDDIVAWMENRHAAADHVLCVVSPEYWEAAYSRLEHNAALWRAVRERSSFLLYVVVKPCALPALTAHMRRCDLYSLPESAARERFRNFMKSPAPPNAVVFPGLVMAESNITIRVPLHFMGRDDAMAETRTALLRQLGRVAITTLQGMRGVGKTILAVAYAEKHRHDYRATWWIRAETEDTMRADLVALGYRLGWATAEDSEKDALAKVANRLRQEGEGILLVFDNAPNKDTIAPFLPVAGTAHVLITSNAHAWRDVADQLEIKVWPRDIGAGYLIARVDGQHERNAAVALSDALGGLPLAHEMAAAYCEELGLTFAAYRERLATTPAEVLDDANSAPAPYNDRLTVAKTFALAIDQAAKLHPAAEPLIVAAAQLSPEPIPLFLFAEGREKLAEGLDGLLEGHGLERAIAALRRLALVTIETIPDERGQTVPTEAIRLHRLIRMIAGWRRPLEAAATVRRGLIEAMVKVYPPDGYNNPSAWPRARRLDALAVDLVDGPDPPLTGAEIATAYLLNWLAEYRQGALAAYAAARPHVERALKICETALGLNHPNTATILNNLARLLQAQGDLAAARPLLERALTIYETALGPEHPDTATSLNNLARLLQDQGDLAAARPLIERSLTIYETALGSDHPNTAASLNSLASLLQAQGDLSAARPLIERALAICETALGPNHPNTATSLNYLAELLQAQSDLAAARTLLERALAIYETALGPDHPSTATNLDNLARLLQAQGDLAAARSLFERALAIRETALGPDHPDTATSLNNLATLLQAQVDLAAARPLFERALTICETALGPDHPDTATILNNLARLFQAQGDLAAARPLLERALTICETVLGLDHPDTATGLKNLAGLLQDQGDLAAALPLFERARTICETAFGPDHPDTAASLNNLARVLQDQGDLATARPLFNRALAIRETALGPDHPDTAMSLNNLAGLLQDQGDFAAARPLFERALTIRETAFGPDHPNTAASLNNLARLFQAQGDIAAARPLFEWALTIYETALGPIRTPPLPLTTSADCSRPRAISPPPGSSSSGR